MYRVLIALLLASCATPGSGVHEMTAAGHDTAASKETQAGATGPAAAHQASADELRRQETEACTGLTKAERETSPLAKASVVAVKQLTWSLGEVGPEVVGASVVVRGDPNVNHGQLQRLLTCYIAHEQLAGAATTNDDPLAVPGISVTVRPYGPGFAVDIMAQEPGSSAAGELWRRASHLGPTR